MRNRIVIIIILLFVLTPLISRNNNYITNNIIEMVNPIKESYITFIDDVKLKNDSYFINKEAIEKLNADNLILQKQLIEQQKQIEQKQNKDNVLADLKQQPIPNIYLTTTISYIKLNKFSQILLTKPKVVQEKKIYGLLQGNVVAGIAKIENNQFNGYLTSDPKCQFSIFIGDKKAPGIIFGLQDKKMIVKFIPKWYDIKLGDQVITSGLDKIFFANIPVGVVTKLDIESGYIVAHIHTYSDVFHPKTFFLINNTEPILSTTFISRHNLTSQQNISNGSIISSIPSRIDQTQRDIVKPIIPVETAVIPIIKRANKTRTNKQRAAQKRANKKRAAQKRASKKRAAQKRASKKRAAQKRANKKRAAQKRASKKRASKKRAAQKRASKKRAAQKRASKKRASKKRAAKKRVKKKVMDQF